MSAAVSRRELKGGSLEGTDMFLTQIENEPYAGHYRDWLQHRAQATGYDFGECPVKAVPPMLRSPRPLRWYSLDRARRLASERQLRDRLVEDILSLGQDSGPRKAVSSLPVDTKEAVSKESRLDPRERSQSRGLRFRPHWEWDKAAA